MAITLDPASKNDTLPLNDPEMEVKGKDKDKRVQDAAQPKFLTSTTSLENKIKILSHVNSIGGVSIIYGEKIGREGAVRRSGSLLIAESLAESNCPFKDDEIEQAFRLSAQLAKTEGHFDYEALAQRIKAGSITTLAIRWVSELSAHVFYLVFCGDHLFICNRGKRSDGLPTIKYYSIDSMKVNARLMEEIALVIGQDQKNVDEYFYYTLPTKLRRAQLKEKDFMIEEMVESLQPNNQKIGNCVYASAKLALRVAILMSLLKQNKSPTTATESLVTKTRRYCKEWSIYLREKTLSLFSDIKELDSKLYRICQLKLLKNKRSLLALLKSQLIQDRIRGEAKLCC
jgi:hypothetical protein